MNNEPVAWFEQDPDMKSIWYQSEQDNPNAIPLYTHPAKTLTDEEIESAWFKVFKPESGIGKNITNGVYDFARLIRESE
jgi:hypothetical protein